MKDVTETDTPKIQSRLLSLLYIVINLAARGLKLPEYHRICTDLSRISSSTFNQTSILGRNYN